MGHNLDLCKKKNHQHACKVSHCHYKKYEWNIVNEGCAFWIVNDVISQTFCYPSAWMCFLLKIWGAREVKLNLVEIIQGTLRERLGQIASDEPHHFCEYFGNKNTCHIYTTQIKLSLFTSRSFKLQNIH